MKEEFFNIMLNIIKMLSENGGINKMKYIITDEQLDLIENADMVSVTQGTRTFHNGKYDPEGSLKENEIYIHFCGEGAPLYTPEEKSFILQGHEQVCVLKQQIAELDIEGLKEF